MKHFRLLRRRPCPMCGGHGTIAYGTTRGTCGVCNGSGYLN
ncbi:hypothetical protein [Microbispora sp. ATCC PTA-5024]|nr:hypothetical protein [Microbispora sp. ATCC PTA-5024]